MPGKRTIDFGNVYPYSAKMLAFVSFMFCIHATFTLKEIPSVPLP